jgi:hypothetical protein
VNFPNDWEPPRPCWIDRALEALCEVRWSHVVPFAFVAFVVGLLVGMMLGFA